MTFYLVNDNKTYVKPEYKQEIAANLDRAEPFIKAVKKLSSGKRV